MLKTLLVHLGAVHVGGMIGVILDQFRILLKQNSHRFFNERVKTCRRIGGEDRISALPDDLLVQILLHVPTRDSIATMVLSKRWRFVWTMVPRLVYSENNDDTREIVVAGLLGRLLDRLLGKTDRKTRSNWRFLEESLRLHKADLLEGIMIQLDRHCPIDIDVGKLITNVVDRKVRELAFFLSWSSEPTKLPKCLYTCDTIVTLGLYDKILVDVPSHMTCFPSLKALGLYYVMYKNEDSIVRLLSSCAVLKYLVVRRFKEDNVTNFKIRVPSLECLLYEYEDNEHPWGTLVIDSPALNRIFITDYSGNSCSIENKPRFDKAIICVHSYLDNKFMRSLASLMYLELSINFATVAFCNVINFSKLLECKITLVQHELDWLEPVMRLLQNSPTLKTIFIDQSMIIGQDQEELSLSWNEPSSVPGCLSTHLEIFEWKGYEGRSKEKEMVKYIFANSKCLKRAGISMKPTCKRKYMKMKELKSMHRISTSSQLLFSTQLEYMNVEDEINNRS